MSSTLPSTPTLGGPNQQPTTTDSSAGGNSPSNTSTTLYLFTFLATLFVLLLISASIIFRSFLIRRRFRQQIGGVLAQGTFLDLPPSGLGLTSRFIGEKPKVHEAWVEQSVLQEKAHWQTIMPVTVLLTHSVEPIGETRHDAPQPRSSFLARLKRRSEFTDLQSTTNNLGASSDDTASVCVLISMPHPGSRFKDDSATLSKSQLFEGDRHSLGTRSVKTTDEEGVPNVVFGISVLPVLCTSTETKGVS